MLRAALLFLCLLLAVPAFAEPFRVVGVADGDTITIEPKHGGARSKVRLHGIDAPETLLFVLARPAGRWQDDM